MVLLSTGFGSTVTVQRQGIKNAQLLTPSSPSRLHQSENGRGGRKAFQKNKEEGEKKKVEEGEERNEKEEEGEEKKEKEEKGEKKDEKREEEEEERKNNNINNNNE